MSLEAEAERQRPVGPADRKSGVRFSPGVEILFRLVALAILVVIATFSVYVPFVLVAPPWGGLAVVAIMLLWLVSLSGRLHALRTHVARLEAVLADGPGAEAGEAPDQDEDSG